jgi:hypothetical protein
MMIAILAAIQRHKKALQRYLARTMAEVDGSAGGGRLVRRLRREGDVGRVT